MPAYEVIEVDRPDGSEAPTFRITASSASQDERSQHFPEGCIFCAENGLLPFRPMVGSGGYVIPNSRTVSVTPQEGAESETRLLPIPFSYLLVPHDHPEQHSLLHGMMNMVPKNPFRSGLPNDWQRHQEQLLRNVPGLEPFYDYTVSYEPIPAHRRKQGWEESPGATKWLPHAYVMVSFGKPGDLEDELLWKIWQEHKDLPNALDEYQRGVTRANALRAAARREWATSAVSHRKPSR